jgi:hypothetical protein
LSVRDADGWVRFVILDFIPLDVGFVLVIQIFQVEAGCKNSNWLRFSRLGPGDWLRLANPLARMVAEGEGGIVGFVWGRVPDLMKRLASIFPNLSRELGFVSSNPQSLTRPLKALDWTRLDLGSTWLGGFRQNRTNIFTASTNPWPRPDVPNGEGPRFWDH